jgi:uncharacterized Fe-S cluster-containing radical SAM superfamily protein
VGGQAVLLEEKDRYLKLLGARFGPRFREYRQNWALAEQRRYLGPFPLSLDLALNSGCQLHCPMCPLPSKPQAQKKLYLPPALYGRLMAEAKEFALPALTLGLGSEPLLCPNPVTRIKEAVKAGIMDIRLGTNGLLLTKPLIEALIDSGLTRLEISLDAVEPQTYRAIRGGDLESLERRIDYFLAKRTKLGSPWPLLRVSFLKLPQNAGELRPFIQRWSSKADLIATQRPIWFPGSKLPKPPAKAVKSVPCGQPWQRLGITYDGQLWPCCSWYGETLLTDSAKLSSIQSVWLSRGLFSLRKSLLLGSPPPQCLLCATAGAF